MFQKIASFVLVPIVVATTSPSASPRIDPWLDASVGSFDVCTPQDSVTAVTVDHLSLFLASTDSIKTNIRQSLGLSGGGTGTVAVETDTIACRGVRRRLDSLINVPSADSTRRVFIARVDTMYVVNDVESPVAHARGGFLVMTRDYRYVGAWR